MNFRRLTSQVPILSTSDTERPKVPMPTASNSHSSPKVSLYTEPKTMNSITRGIPSILPMASSNIPHTHTVVCYSPTCITNQLTTGSCNNTYPINLPIHTSAKPRYSEEKSFHDLSEETNVLSPTNNIHQSLEHPKTAAREHKALIPEEPDLQGSSREATEILIQNLAHNVKEIFASITTEMTKLRGLIHECSLQRTGYISNPTISTNNNQNRNAPQQSHPHQAPLNSNRQP